MSNIQPFRTHYYFDDESHSMNAFVRNRAEKDLLEAIKRVGVITELEFQIETQAYNEGGLIETLIITGSALSVVKFLSPAINGVIQHYFTRDKELDALQKQKLAEEIKNIQLDAQKKEWELQQLFDDKQAQRHISNYYKKIEAYSKVKSIGFKSGDAPELIVRREQFKDFILVDDTTVIEDENAEIEIISPVLKEGRYKWKGRYNGEKVDFSMGDSKFKQDVIERKHSFSNGITILANLQITTTYDEFGDEKSKSFSVKKVYGIKPEDDVHWRMRPIGSKKKREVFESEHIKSLFSEEGEK